jgi:hypothetical protein
VAYRLQADRFGDLDPQSKRALDGAEAPEKAGQNATPLAERLTELKAGTILGREWNGRMHRVSALADGFAYEGKTYSSLSKIAFAITGTRWNGPGGSTRECEKPLMYCVAATTNSFACSALKMSAHHA